MTTDNDHKDDLGLFRGLKVAIPVGLLFWASLLWVVFG